MPWLEPYPDALAEGRGIARPGPGVRYGSGEAMSLGFLAGLQRLPPFQRAALVLRDVLGFCIAETAEILDVPVGVIDGAVMRARVAMLVMMRNASASGAREPPPAPGSPAECELVRRLTEAYAAGDVSGVVSLLTEDVWITVQAMSAEYQGRELAARLLALLFGRGRTYRLVPTRANGQPAFGVYAGSPRRALLHASALMVVTPAGERIRMLSYFEAGQLARFGLPRTLEA